MNEILKNGTFLKADSEGYFSSPTPTLKRFDGHGQMLLSLHAELRSTDWANAFTASICGAPSRAELLWKADQIWTCLQFSTTRIVRQVLLGHGQRRTLQNSTHNSLLSRASRPRTSRLPPSMVPFTTTDS